MTPISYATMAEDPDYSEKGTYHIHIDAKQMSNTFRSFIKENLQFVEDPFDPNPRKDRVSFVPNICLSRKFLSKEEFGDAWDKLSKICMGVNPRDMAGYSEGEFIAHFENIPYKPYTGEKPPFTIARRKLQGPPAENFRQSEVHIVMETNKSSPQLIENLLDAGFYAGYFTEGNQKGIVITIQGYTRDIESIYHATKQYLEKVGGAANCNISLEVAVYGKLINTSVDALPEIADKIEYTTT